MYILAQHKQTCRLSKHSILDRHKPLRHDAVLALHIDLLKYSKLKSDSKTSVVRRKIALKQFALLN